MITEAGAFLLGLVASRRKTKDGEMRQVSVGGRHYSVFRMGDDSGHKGEFIVVLNAKPSVFWDFADEGEVEAGLEGPELDQLKADSKKFPKDLFR